jgi:cell division protein FtsZ
MGRRQVNATHGLDMLQTHTDTLITIPNDRLLYVAPRNLPLELAFRLADDVLRQAVQGISELITQPGMINVDFAHVRRMMKLGGGAIMAIGHGEGKNKVKTAVDQALNHPLLDNIDVNNAEGIIANFTGSDDLTLYEVQEALTHLQSQTSSRAEIVMGLINDECMQDRVQVTLIITGIGATTLEQAMEEVDRAKPIRRKLNEMPEPSIQPLNLNQKELVSTHLSAPPSASDLDLPAFLRQRTRYAG